MELAPLLPFVAIALLFWLMIVRPASRRQKDIARLQQSLRPGQQVMLAAGIVGTVRSLSDDRARVEISPGVEIEVVRGAVTTVLSPTDVDGETRPAIDPDSGDHA
jgi:preprotein translocase subunit YajC